MVVGASCTFRSPRLGFRQGLRFCPVMTRYKGTDASYKTFLKSITNALMCCACNAQLPSREGVLYLYSLGSSLREYSTTY
eukprot:6589097-Pyramimonas_sp.AAC.1